MSYVILLFTLVVFAFYIFERRKRRRIEKEFSSYLSLPISALYGVRDVRKMNTSFFFARHFLKTVQEVVEIVHGVLKGGTSAFYLKEKDLFRLRGSVSDASLREIIQPRGPIEWVMKEKKPLLVDEFYEDASSLGYYDGDAEVRSLCAVPVLIGDELVGILIVDSPEAFYFSELDKEKIKAFSSFIATLVSLYRHIDAYMIEAFQFRLLQELAKEVGGEIEFPDLIERLEGTIRELFPGTSVFIFVLRDGFIDVFGDERIRVSESPCFATIILEQGIPLRDNNIKRESEIFPGVFASGVSLLFSPFPLKNGGIIILSKKGFGEKDLTILSFLSEIAGTAIEKSFLYEREKERAVRDGLTGLYNHRHLQECLEELVRKGKEFSLIMIDIDHFKRINDTYGHQAGDEILKEVSRVIMGCVRKDDFVARYGGEEIACVLVGASKKDAVDVAEVIRSRIEGHIFEWGGGRVKVTVSIGVSHFPGSGMSREEVIEKADSALYRAKREGRNRVAY